MTKTSYFSAGQIPIKLFKNSNVIQDKMIVPYHIQYMPTNRCNLKCSWCSCSNVDRRQEMHIVEAIELIEYFSKLGTKAITITGGGEPLLYKELIKFVNRCYELGISMGLVSACTCDIPSELDNYLTWLRISITYKGTNIEEVCKILPNVDIGISYTVDREYDLDYCKYLCDLSKRIKNMTHIRFVQNLLEPDNTKYMDIVSKECYGLSNKVHFQYRNNYTKGAKECYISKLKPVIDPNGNVFPCCGVQYASKVMARKMPDEFIFCHWRDFHKSNIFDGSVCHRCYYDNYNSVLSGMLEDIQHLEFV